MRVTWVHPSWRDLVIDHLADDRDARVAFIERAELPGLLLALSTEGGARGERSLPLLVSDADWDALADAAHRLARTLAEPDLLRLFVALEAAAKAPLDERARSEIRAALELIVETVRRRFDHEPGLITARSLGSWLILARRVAPRPKPPDLSLAWQRLRPTESLRLRNPAHLRQVDEWLALAEVIGKHDPHLLDRLGFERDVGVLQSVFVYAASGPPIRSTLMISILTRLSLLAPGAWPEQIPATGPELPASEPMPPPPDARRAELSESDRIGRILADL